VVLVKFKAGCVYCCLFVLAGAWNHRWILFNKKSKLNAPFVFIQLTESKSMQAMCQVYAAVSYICIGDAESYSQVKYLV
jgi:hypothetical protein